MALTGQRKYTTKTRASKEPLQHAKELIENAFGAYKNKVIELYSSLNEKIMMSAFEEAYTPKSIRELRLPTLEVIESLRNSVLEFLTENQRLTSKKPKGNNALIKRVNAYFDNIKNVTSTKRSGSNSLAYLANINQFKKINDLVDEFAKFEKANNTYYRPLREFLDTINLFFADSSKELYYDKESYSLFFNVFDKNNKRIIERKNITNLSSGEKQILILLSYLKFNSNKLYIIDEPELSLHPKWQQEFLPAVNKLMNKGSQLLLATHSPEIVGNNEESCTVLLPYND